MSVEPVTILRKPFDLAELKLRVEQVVKTQCFSSSDESIELPFGMLMM